MTLVSYEQYCACVYTAVCCDGIVAKRLKYVYFQK